MNVIFENLNKDYEGKIVFNNISGRVNNNDRIGFIGINGIGKTTLAKLIADLEEYESGIIKYSPRNAKVIYLSQSLDINKSSSVYDEVFNAAKKIEINDSNLAARVKKALTYVGLDENMYSQDISTLSGGEKTKVMLCKAIMEDFDLLILDEPTNHLDMESCRWFEGFLNRLNKTTIIISHDRYFLDKTVTKIWEMTAKELKEYEGNYTSYKHQKEIETKNAAREFEKQQQKIEHLKGIINDRKNWFNLAHKAAGQNDFARAKSKKHVSIMRAKEKELERIKKNKIDRPKEDVAACFEILNKSITNIKLPKYLVQGKDLDKNFGERIIFSKASFNIMRGDKVALLGKNGMGKTTLLKMLNGIDSNYKGAISINPSVNIGYFAQELDTLDYEKSILDNVLYQGITQAEARLLLACLLFKGEDVFKEVKNLSMGEKCRVAFAKLILSGANLLVLDEPTNYMDIVSKEKIEEILIEFQGSILFVSHDRYFVNRLSNKILEISNRQINCYLGSYEEYLDKKENDSKAKAAGNDYKDIKDIISRLECELSFLSGKFNDKLTDEEKSALNEKFILTAREINSYKEKLKDLEIMKY